MYLGYNLKPKWLVVFNFILFCKDNKTQF